MDRSTRLSEIDWQDFADRGTLEPGAKADVNVIDYDNLSVSHPEMIYDLPAGMPRLMQTANGYEKTFVSGEVVQENGKDTGARPGRIVRSAWQPICRVFLQSRALGQGCS